MRKQFFIVGVQKCFTTWLEKTLSSHPEVDVAKAIPPNEEVKYFLNKKIFKKEYENFFYNKNFKNCYVEKSVSYIENNEAIENIKNVYPDSGFIICLRDPVERFLSHFFFNKKNGIENRNIEEIIEQNYADSGDFFGFSMNPYSYFERSKYSNYIENFLKNNKKTIVTISENLIEKDIYKIFNFLKIKKLNYIDKNPIRKTERENINEKIIEKIKNKIGNEKKNVEKILGFKIPYWN